MNNARAGALIVRAEQQQAEEASKAAVKCSKAAVKQGNQK
jgi:hypothetical protein